MSAPEKFTIMLDRPRAIAWDGVAEVRLDAVSRRLRTGGALYHMCALAWAMLCDRDDRFDEPEKIGAYLTTSEQIKKMADVLLACRMAATEANEKKEPGST